MVRSVVALQGIADVVPVLAVVLGNACPRPLGDAIAALDIAVVPAGVVLSVALVMFAAVLGEAVVVPHDPLQSRSG